MIAHSGPSLAAFETVRPRLSGIAYRQIASVLALREAHARQLVTRARRGLGGDHRRRVDVGDHQRLLSDVVIAARAGDVATHLLTADVPRRAPGPPASPSPRRTLPMTSTRSRAAAESLLRGHREPRSPDGGVRLDVIDADSRRTAMELLRWRIDVERFASRYRNASP